MQESRATRSQTSWSAQCHLGITALSPRCEPAFLSQLPTVYIRLLKTMFIPSCLHSTLLLQPAACLLPDRYPEGAPSSLSPHRHCLRAISDGPQWFECVLTL